MNKKPQCHLHFIGVHSNQTNNADFSARSHIGQNVTSFQVTLIGAEIGELSERSGLQNKISIDKFDQ